MINHIIPLNPSSPSTNLEMDTFELFKVINDVRVLGKEKPYPFHKDFVKKVKREIDDLSERGVVTYNIDTFNSGSRSFSAYKLSEKDIFLVAMRESKYVRNQVYDYLVEQRRIIQEQAYVIKEQKHLLDEQNKVIGKTVRKQKWISQTQALKSAGIKKPIVFMKMLTSNTLWLSECVDKGYLAYMVVNKHLDRAWRFSNEGLDWLMTNTEELNDKVSEYQKRK